uniref:Uncharacterized protein n=1 Tax=Leersia perrieri TaxID=77586 RepID=A0A0D9WDL8_9ORYZ
MAGLERDELKVSPNKRKAESFAAKRSDLSESKSSAAAPVLAGDGEEEAPEEKKMWLLPKEEVRWILAQSNEPVCRQFRDLKRRNPSLVPSPEEKDKKMMLLYQCARESYDAEEEFANFQAWVRGEYARKGFVEVDYDYFAERADNNRRCDQAREEVFGHWDFTSDSEDDDIERLIKRTCRRFV